MNLKDKKVLITGGSEGLGFSLAKALISKGCRVIIVARNPDKLKSASDSINSSSLKTFVCEVSDYRSVNALATEVGYVDILINNAGVWLEGSLSDSPYEKIKSVVETNLAGVIYVTKAFLPAMIKRNSGLILNVSSTSGLEGRDGQTAYAASKWGVRGFTESLTLELAKTDVNVFGFYPGGMNTTLFRKAGFDKDVSSWMNTDEVADLLINLLEREGTMLIDQLVLKKRKKTT
jgi:3-oxoacyl-[acyl-carrier protein] reductase